MKTLIKNIVIGAAGLMLAAAPLAASAQSGDHDRGARSGQLPMPAITIAAITSHRD